MTEAAAIPSRDTSRPRQTREPLGLTRRDFLWPLAFMLSMTMAGLQFAPALLFILIILLNRFKNDRYDFIIQITLVFGGYSFLTNSTTFVNMSLMALIVSAVSVVILRKPRILKKTLIATVVYFLSLVYLASLSDEAMSVQWAGMRNYFMILYIFVPFVVFSGRDFDFRQFSRHLFPYAVIICTFYILDSAIMGGLFFVPSDAAWATYGYFSTFYDPWIDFLGFTFPRRWPMGLFVLIMIVYPAARFYKVPWWMLLLVIGSLLVCRTFTFVMGLIVVYVFCRATSGKRIMLYVVLLVGALVGLYYIDGLLPEKVNELGEGEGDAVTKESSLRIKSSFDQIIDLDPSKADDETLARIGTGRGAQIIPKMELLYSFDRQWIGLGFLSRQDTKSSKYMIENELYSNPEDAEEVATGVESVPFQIILDVGFIGLIIHILFFIVLWIFIRRLPYAGYYMSIALIFSIIGISGFSGLIRIHGQLMAALAFAAVILNDKRHIDGFDLAPLRRSAETAVHHP